MGEEENKVVFTRVTRKEDMCLIRISDASYHQED